MEEVTINAVPDCPDRRSSVRRGLCPAERPGGHDPVPLLAARVLHGHPRARLHRGGRADCGTAQVGEPPPALEARPDVTRPAGPAVAPLSAPLLPPAGTSTAHAT